MSDVEQRLRDLLVSSAAEPPRNIAIEAVRRRARQQRWALGAGALSGAGVLAAAVLVSMALLSGADPEASQVGSGSSDASPGPSAAGTSPPQLTVTPNDGLRDGQVVVVEISQFAPGTKAFISECATKADVSGAGCGAQLASQPFLMTDGHGHASGTFEVTTSASGGAYDPDRTVDCTECVLVVTTGQGARATVASASIGFAAGR